MKSRFVFPATLTVVTLFAFVLQGYHPGAEDDGIYLSAIKSRLDPLLYSFNKDFIVLQVQATLFDETLAALTRLLHLPVAYTCFLCQIASIGLLLWGCWRLLDFCFCSFRAKLGGILTVACLLSLSVAGTALYISDEHLHPRLLATVFLVFALGSMQRQQYRTVILCLVAAMLFHPIMGAFGISLCAFYAAASRFTPRWFTVQDRAQANALTVPGSWLLAPATPSWRMALRQHSYYTLAGWHWYELLGAVAPPLILYFLAQLARTKNNLACMQLAAGVLLYSLFQFTVAVFMLVPKPLERLIPLQPMRYLHLTFLLMALLAGAALAEYVLARRIWLWLLVFVPLAAANGYAQRLRYPATPNLELPWSAPAGDWIRAFLWVRGNTPKNAVFALDPEYLSLPGDDNHSFRAIAERSSLVDARKDAAVVVQVLQLGETWRLQYGRLSGWQSWTAVDFYRLAATTPVRWVIVAPRQSKDLSCPYSNPSVSVCDLSAGKPLYGPVQFASPGLAH